MLVVDHLRRAVRDGVPPRTAPVLLAVGYALLVLAWSMGNPPFAAPDEWAHHLRTIGVSQGELIGERAAWPIAKDASELRIMQTTWANQALRTVRVPAGASPAGLDCNAFRLTESAACVERPVPQVEQVQLTPVGTYQPAPYLLPALVIRLAGDPRTANRLARVVSALPCLALLLATALVLCDGGLTPSGLIGPLVAITPMVVFLIGTLNGSGLEISSGLAFAAALARLGRPGDVRASTWALAGTSGALLALSRSTGALWTVVLLVAFLVGIGTRPWLRPFRRTPRAALGALVAIAVGIAASRVWEARYGAHVAAGLGPWPGGVGDLVAMLRAVVRQYLGLFGTIDSPMPRAAYLLWSAMTVLLLVLAALTGSVRERLVVVATFLGLVVAAPLLLQALVLWQTGFAVQGRHVLPVATAAPIMAAEILARRELRTGARWATRAVGAVALVAATVQLVGWSWNARRQATGIDGALWFVPAAEWTPPLGWVPWLALATAGALTLVAAGVVAARTAAPEPRARPQRSAAREP